MASPIVSGAVALLNSYDSTLTTEQIFSRLIQGANNGILDIYSSMVYELVPDLHYVSYAIVDTLPGGDEDGVTDAGETIELYLTVKNAGGYADSVWAKIRFGEFEDTTTADIIDSTSYIGDISAYATLTGESDPFIIEIDPNVVNNRDIVFEYEIGSRDQQMIAGDFSLKVQRGTEVGGLISGHQVWSAGNIYIVTENIRIMENSSLTVKPGTTILLNGDKQIEIRGSLIMEGKKDSLIVFSSNESNKGIGFLLPPISLDSVIITFTKFEYLDSPILLGGWEFSKIKIEDCIFTFCGTSLLGDFISLYLSSRSTSNDGTGSFSRNILVNNAGKIYLASYYGDETLKPYAFFNHNILCNNYTYSSADVKPVIEGSFSEGQIARLIPSG